MAPKLRRYVPKPNGKTQGFQSFTFTFRPRKALERDYRQIMDWCSDDQIRMPISAVFNSLLPALALALHNYTYQMPDGSIMVRMDLGDIEICRRSEHEKIDD